MVDSLLEIEVAYNLLQSEDGADSGKDPIDAHFEKLRTKMEVLERDSDEFRMLEDYVKNTHASTHTLYTLEIEQVSERRGGEVLEPISYLFRNGAPLS